MISINNISEKQNIRYWYYDYSANDDKITLIPLPSKNKIYTEESFWNDIIFFINSLFREITFPFRVLHSFMYNQVKVSNISEVNNISLSRYSLTVCISPANHKRTRILKRYQIKSRFMKFLNSCNGSEVTKGKLFYLSNRIQYLVISIDLRERNNIWRKDIPNSGKPRQLLLWSS